MSRAASQSKRASQARSGVGGRCADGGTTQLKNGIGGKYTATNGSVMNWGGNSKFGLYPTVGKSVGFLNILSNCCHGKEKKGVNLGIDCKNYTAQDRAYLLLENYFKKQNLFVVLIAKEETLKTDGVTEPGFESINHYYSGTALYDGLPLNKKKAVDVLNNIKFLGPIVKDGTPLLHVVGTTSIGDIVALNSNGFGTVLSLGNKKI